MRYFYSKGSKFISTLFANLTGIRRRSYGQASMGKARIAGANPTRGFSVLFPYRDYMTLSVTICIYSGV
jgi:hypothetical protein